jgi:hypothetical protein
MSWMNIQMNELHGIGIRDITSFFNDEFHEEWTRVCLDIVDKIHEPFSWHLIGFLLVLKCVLSHHTHANEQDIGVNHYKSLNLKSPPLHIPGNLNWKATTLTCSQ